MDNLAPISAYGTLYRQWLWPAYEKLRGRRTHKLLADAEARQWWPAEKLHEWQQRELTALLQHARANCPWYRDQHGDSLLLSKAIIREHRDELVAGNYRDRVFMHKTGGSTGEPLSFYMTRESYEWRNAMMLRGYGWAGAQEGERAFFLWALTVTPVSRLQSLKTKLHDGVLRRHIFNSFPLTTDRMRQCVDSLNQFAPHVLVGYTSLLEYLARHIQKHGGLRVKLHSVITAAESINTSQRELLREVYQAPVFASYGSREFKLIAMECERGSLHLSADNLHVEIIRDGRPAQPGELGQILITDLHNYGMPFIRYEIGDVAAATTDTCPCGRSLPLLGPVQGRVADMIRTPDGRLISGLFFPHLLKEFAWVQEYQVVQRELDCLHLKIVTADTAVAETGLAALRDLIAGMFGPTIRLQIEFVDEIPRTVSGKHRAVLSEIPVQI